MKFSAEEIWRECKTNTLFSSHKNNTTKKYLFLVIRIPYSYNARTCTRRGYALLKVRYHLLVSYREMKTPYIVKPVSLHLREDGNTNWFRMTQNDLYSQTKLGSQMALYLFFGVLIEGTILDTIFVFIKHRIRYWWMNHIMLCKISFFFYISKSFSHWTVSKAYKACKRIQTQSRYFATSEDQVPS